MKLYFTKQELIKHAKPICPELKGEDLEHYALGGYVETKKGFIEFNYWQIEKNKKKRKKKLIKRR